jgi:alkylation response protein AidB-like acyl-CoA dehydrogenase
MAMPIQDELALLEDNVRRFAEHEIGPFVEAMEHYPDGPLPEEVAAGLRNLGLLALCLPASVGGDDGGAPELTRVLHALTETSAAAATTLLAHAFAQRLVTRVGDAITLEAIAADGSGGAPLLAYPLYAEPAEVGRDAAWLSGGTTVRVTGRWELVVNAPIAERLVLPIRPEGGATALIVVDATAPGVAVGEALKTLGMHGSPVSDVDLRGVNVPHAQLLALDRLDPLVRATYEEMRGPAAAISTAVARASLRTALGYARERYQGGRQIVDHQEVRRILGEMMADADQCAQAAEALAAGTLAEPAATGLFLRARAAAARATCDGVQLLGGNGYMEDYGQERCMRDAKQAQCLLGRNEALRQWMLEGYLAEGGTP